MDIEDSIIADMENTERKIAHLEKNVVEKDKALSESKKALNESKKIIQEKNKALEAAIDFMMSQGMTREEAMKKLK